MIKGFLKTAFDIETLYDFGVVDTFHDGWKCTLTMRIECYKGNVYLRLSLTRKSKYGSIKSVTFSVINSKGMEFNKNNSILYFKQFERCWSGEIGEPDRRGNFTKYIDEKLLGYKWIGGLQKIPNSVHDPDACESLICFENKRLGEGYEIGHIKRKINHVSSYMLISRVSVGKILSALGNYT